MHFLCCEVFRPELEWLAGLVGSSANIRYLEQGLHERPDELRMRLQEHVTELENAGERQIVLGYGLCGRGVAGVRARGATMIMPRVHDCIAMFLGCGQRDVAGASIDGGTFWMTPGWLRYSQIPFRKEREKRREDYARQYGAENADYLMSLEREWLKNYTSACYIRRAGFPGQEKIKSDAMFVADDAGLPYRSVEGKNGFLLEFLAGGTSERFIRLVPGETPDIDSDGNIIATKAG